MKWANYKSEIRLIVKYAKIIPHMLQSLEY